jgi:hypothetical protein
MMGGSDLDEITRAIDASLDTRLGWSRWVEIAVRGVACVAAFSVAGALVFGLWQPSAERTAQWTLAFVLLWGAAHLLRSMFGAAVISPVSHN